MANDVFRGVIVEPSLVNQSRLDEIIPLYQEAFTGDPWFEVSKCPSGDKDVCPGGYSSVEIGDACGSCGLIPSQPAHGTDEIRTKFLTLAETRPMSWYIEENGEGDIALAAFATLATSTSLFEERYADHPEMSQWLADNINGEIAWLDEVFANKAVRPSGNLKNFGDMICRLAKELHTNTVAYRTINTRMLTAAKRDFGDRAVVNHPREGVLDHRYFVKINLEGEI